MTLIIAANRWLGVQTGYLVTELPVQLARLREVLDAGGPEVHLRAAELEPFIVRLETTGRRLGPR